VINLNDGTKQLNFHTMGIVPFGSLCWSLNRSPFHSYSWWFWSNF
jgi:hypothetical protein